MEKVKLPKEVAEAIEQELQRKDDERLSWSIQNMVNCKIHQLTSPAAVIKKYFEDGKWMILMKALINGYEVEQTPEDKVADYIVRLRNIRDQANTDADRQRELNVEISGALQVLEHLGIKISGVNEL